MQAATRTRFRFTLRALLVTVTLISLGLAYAANWSHQRQRFVPEHGYIVGTESPPWPLWVLKERGVNQVLVENDEDEKLAQRLFPEARVVRADFSKLDRLRFDMQLKRAAELGCASGLFSPGH
jgi:hypothetical protein